MAAIANFAGVKPRVNAARAGRFAGSRVSKVRVVLHSPARKNFRARETWPDVEDKISRRDALPPSPAARLRSTRD